MDYVFRTVKCSFSVKRLLIRSTKGTQLDVEATHLNFAWNQWVVDHHQRSGRVSDWNVEYEQTATGDDTDVQGHWGQQVNQSMSAVFRPQARDNHIGDFRATTSQYKKVPDIVGAGRWP